jgi:hypothetical protein
MKRGTIYSWVVELGTGQVHVAHGRPCQNKYQVITLEASLQPPSG